MKPFGFQALVAGTTVASLLAARAIKKKSLSKAGAAAGFGVGFFSIVTGWRGMNLMVFYQLGSTATKFKKLQKQQMDATAAEAAVRGAFQVLACSILATALSLGHAYYCGEESPINFIERPLASRLTCAVLAHHATCLADTLASELGILAKKPPILITQPWRTVPAGTNGGVTVVGTLCSLAGGVLMGLSTVAMDAITGLSPLRVVETTLYGGLCGVIGSMVDSLLGATLQVTYWDADTKMVYHANQPLPKTAKSIVGVNLLTNEQVNLVSVAVTTFFGGWVLAPWFYSKFD
jgi:uncharacterized protein (TIGR00297 family)